LLRVGHKGADALVPGNTVESFAAAVEVGIDVIEFDVLRPRGDFPSADWRRAPAGPAAGTGPLLVAHDWAAAARRERDLTLDAALDAFTRPPLDRVRFDLDLKIAGREDEVVAALEHRGLVERAMVSTMESSSVAWLRDAAPGLERGWTVPKVSKDWSKSRPLRPLFLAGMATFRARLPQIVSRRAPELGAWAVWIHHGLISARLLAAAHGAGVQVIAWTVDDAARVAELAALGVDGICSNDPRLLNAP
jgi:glycerophosphoryl diester phosphodiesterase